MRSHIHLMHFKWTCRAERNLISQATAKLQRCDAVQTPDNENIDYKYNESDR